MKLRHLNTSLQFRLLIHEPHCMLSLIWGIFSSTFFFFFSYVPLPLKSQSRGPNFGIEAQIPVLRPKSQPQGPNPSLEAGTLPSKL